MDNHYVPNLTIGPGVCKALRDHGVTAPIDVHLMVSPVDRIIGDFVDAGWYSMLDFVVQRCNISGLHFLFRPFSNDF